MKLPCGKFGESCLDLCPEKKPTDFYSNNQIEECYHSYKKRQREKVELPNGKWVSFIEADEIKQGLKSVADYEVKKVESTSIICPFCEVDHGTTIKKKYKCRCNNEFTVRVSRDKFITMPKS